MTQRTESRPLAVAPAGTDPRPRVRRLLVLALLLLVVACAGEFTTQSEPLRLLAGRLPAAVIDEPYAENIQAVGGLRPYTFTLDSGSLPPGVTLDGGSLRGTPTVAGTYEFTISVSDANLSSTFEPFTLQVVTPPPTRLTLQPPDTEARGAVTLRARVSDARSLAGARIEITWDPQQFTLVEDSVSAARRDFALFHEASPGLLRVDLAVLADTLDGSAQLFSFALLPNTPPALVAVRFVTEFASRRSGALLFEQQSATEGPGDVGRQEEPADSPNEEPADSPGGESGDEPGDESDPSDADGDGS